MAYVRACTGCDQCVSKVCNTLRSHVVLLLVLIVASVVTFLCGFPILALFVSVAGPASFLGCMLAEWLIFGCRIYVWLDQNNRLHIHRGSWWRGLAGNNVEVQKRIPESNILSLWLGPWPCRSRVLGEICSASILWKIKVKGRWSFFPSLHRDLVLFDACGFFLQMPLFEETSRGIMWHTNNISLVLKTIGQRQCLDEVLRVAIKADHDSDSPVAGNIGTG